MDLTRAIAIISVVLCHSVEFYFYVYRDHSFFWNTIDLSLKLFDCIGITLGRVGVPLFFLLTGALVLKKTMDSSDSIRKFYKKNYLSLLITMELWIIIWNLWLIFYRYEGGETDIVTVKTIVEDILLVKVVDTIMPSWYVPVILFIYLLLPFFIIGVKKLDFSIAIIPITGIVVYSSLIPTINSILISCSLETIPVPVQIHDLIFIVYILMGYYVSEKQILSKVGYKLLLTISIASLGLCAVMQYCLCQAGFDYKLFYDNIFLLISTVCMFELFRRMNSYVSAHKKGSSIITNISIMSLGIFFIHNLVQYTLYLYTKEVTSELSSPICVIMMFVASFSISIVLVMILKNNGITKKYLLRIR